MRSGTRLFPPLRPAGSLPAPAPISSPPPPLIPGPVSPGAAPVAQCPEQGDPERRRRSAAAAQGRLSAEQTLASHGRLPQARGGVNPSPPGGLAAPAGAPLPGSAPLGGGPPSRPPGAGLPQAAAAAAAGREGGGGGRGGAAGRGAERRRQRPARARLAIRGGGGRARRAGLTAGTAEPPGQAAQRSAAQRTPLPRPQPVAGRGGHRAARPARAGSSTPGAEARLWRRPPASLARTSLTWGDPPAARGARGGDSPSTARRGGAVKQQALRGKCWGGQARGGGGCTTAPAGIARRRPREDETQLPRPPDPETGLLGAGAVGQAVGQAKGALAQARTSPPPPAAPFLAHPLLASRTGLSGL